MATTWLKRAAKTAQDDSREAEPIVRDMLARIEEGREEAAAAYARDLDNWAGDIVVPPEAIAEAAARLPQQVKDDLAYAHDNIRRFAEMQRDLLTEGEMEVVPGLTAGQKVIPVDSVGCYVPGGRYAHVASALMTVTTAKVAGVRHIAACSPPKPGAGIPDAILYALDLCGADRVLAIGGVQGVAALAFGLYGAEPADVLAGPGNRYVAEAKRLLFGRVGIDMIAGPTDILVIADESSDAEAVAVDLVGQAEHGDTSPVWLVTTDRALAERVATRAPELIETLPEPNRTAAAGSWANRAEIILCDTGEEAAERADAIAPEHLHVHAADLDWWLGRLSAYGSLFLGAETTVSYGDKCSGPNHVLPTMGSARYTGGLSVHKFLKIVTWQRMTAEASAGMAGVCGRISRLEGMEAHARSADLRLKGGG
jgi:sulfopropanediol 3-dehydrogenase